jgi:hypothetical protein
VGPAGSRRSLPTRWCSCWVRRAAARRRNAAFHPRRQLPQSLLVSIIVVTAMLVSSSARLVKLIQSRARALACLPAPVCGLYGTCMCTRAVMMQAEQCPARVHACQCMSTATSGSPSAASMTFSCRVQLSTKVPSDQAVMFSTSVPPSLRTASAPGAPGADSNVAAAAIADAEVESSRAA